MAPPNIKVATGKEQELKEAGNRVKSVKTKITVLIEDGSEFQALKEIKTNMEVTDPASSAVFKEYARATAMAKVAEVQGLMGELESACNNMKAVTISLGTDHNSKELIDSAIANIEASYANYKTAGTTGIKSLAAYTSLVSTTTSTTPASTTSRVENKFSKISHTAEPCALPRDVSPSDFKIWMRKFNTFSGASWIPGPPTSGEELRQLMVYLGVPWSD